MLISIVCSFVMAHAMIGSAVITAKVVDSNGNLDTADLFQYVGLLLGSGILAAVSTYCNSLLTEKKYRRAVESVEKAAAASHAVLR